MQALRKREGDKLGGEGRGGEVDDDEEEVTAAASAGNASSFLSRERKQGPIYSLNSIEMAQVTADTSSEAEEMKASASPVNVARDDIFEECPLTRASLLLPSSVSAATSEARFARGCCKSPMEEIRRAWQSS